MFRTDSHKNPTAFTTDIAKAAGLTLGVDYSQGQAFQAGANTYYTAQILGDPIATTIRVIDAIGFRTKTNVQRWTYISLPRFVWIDMSLDQKTNVIGWMYQQEGGTEMRGLFPHYGRP